MIGNDIIDVQLASIQSNWKRRGWLQKIFTAAEQECITTSEMPEIIVWKFWSMKEATYKAHQRRFTLPRSYNPKSFECLEDGYVQVGTLQYQNATEITENYVYSVAFPEGIPMISKVFQGYKNKAREALKYCLEDKYKLQSKELIYKHDREGVPQIQSPPKRNKEFDFSLTHHGRFSAFALLT